MERPIYTTIEIDSETPIFQPFSAIKDLFDASTPHITNIDVKLMRKLRVATRSIRKENTSEIQMPCEVDFSNARSIVIHGHVSEAWNICLSSAGALTLSAFMNDSH